MSEKQIWISTRLHHNETIREMTRTFGMISMLALQRLWCFAKEYYEGGKLDKNFVDGFRQHVALSSFDEDEFNEYEPLLERKWIDWLVENNLLEKTDDGYKIVFGLVHFDQPEKEVQNQ